MKNQMNQPEKPLCLRKREASAAIEIAINSAAASNALSFSDLEDILYRYYVEVQRGAERERRNAESLYNRQMADYQQKKEKKEVEADGGDYSSESDA